ncbi:MAG: hypothetical protein ABWY06_13205 [Pseudomonas sp.]|uniref:hypothetical protein n=1 Tax=Pseudomonas sp. TaxID=306 RepID=UPI00339A7CB9
MQCFEHRANAAVGLCRACGRGVCPECAIAFPKGLACCSACEADAKELIEMNERAKKLYGIGQYHSNKLASGVIVWLLLSAVMCSTAGYVYVAKGRLDYVTTAMAVVFLIITFIVYRASKKTGIQC